MTFSTNAMSFAGAKHVSAHRGARFTLAQLAMQAAIDSASVVLGRIVLAEGDLATGRLVRPFKAVLPLDVSYFLVRSNAAPRQEIQCFRDWLFSSLKLSPVTRHYFFAIAIKACVTAGASEKTRCQSFMREVAYAATSATRRPRRRCALRSAIAGSANDLRDRPIWWNKFLGNRMLSFLAIPAKTYLITPMSPLRGLICHALQRLVAAGFIHDGRSAFVM